MRGSTGAPQIVTIQTEAGEEFFAEVVDDGADAGLATRRLAIAARQIEATITRVAGSVRRSIANAVADDPPSRGTAEFGLKFNAKSPGGVVLGEIGAESSIVVRLEWSTSPAE